jgi:trimethylamine--corrinoid protein Co-methyltransferase
VGPGGNFLAEDQTLTLHRQEHWRPVFLNRDDPETWMTKGSKSYGEKVIRKTIEILESHRSEPLPDDVRQTIDEMARRAEQSLAGRFIKA